MDDGTPTAGPTEDDGGHPGRHHGRSRTGSRRGGARHLRLPLTANAVEVPVGPAARVGLVATARLRSPDADPRLPHHPTSALSVVSVVAVRSAVLHPVPTRRGAIRRSRRWPAAGLLAVLALLLPACAAASGPPPLVVGGIPDQHVQRLEERFGGLAEHLAEELGIDVVYRPSTSYAALVAAFHNGDVQLGWFGGLTGVQARAGVPGAHAVAQRPIDTEFRSVIVAGASTGITEVADLAGRTFTFGSESSTSGHLMPRAHLVAAGLDPDADLAGAPGYSGSHDKTWKLVAAGAYDAGALNAAVWEDAVRVGAVDAEQVRVIATVGPYADYHWVTHPALDERYGGGTTQRLVDALLALRPDTAERAHLLELFGTDRFVPAHDRDYHAVAAVARDLGLLGGTP